MTISPLAGKPAAKEMLVDLAKLEESVKRSGWGQPRKTSSDRSVGIESEQLLLQTAGPDGLTPDFLKLSRGGGPIP
jgi:hypothetical protein